MEELREARRPQVAYGSQVRRCLRGRWFSLVPVHRTAFCQCLGGLAIFVLVLIFMHDASVRYSAIADQAAWVDVLRINRYGSLGRYAIGILYLGLAGSAWLVYQLRRYRNDDFSGNYQLWQWVVASALVASVASSAPIVAMLGGGIEWVMGRRVALSGEDWIELLLIVGGAIFALRTIAEMWRYRFCMALMLGGWAWMAIPIAADWNMLGVEDLSRWTWVTSAPLIAVSMWFASTVGYLRSLYREVRGIESAPGWIARLRVVAERSATRDPQIERGDLASEIEEDETGEIPTTRKAKPVTKPKLSGDETTSRADQHVNEPDGKGRRRWWLLGRRSDRTSVESPRESTKKPAVAEEASVSVVKAGSKADDRGNATDDTNDDGVDSDSQPPRRSWWPSLKRKPRTAPELNDADEQDVSDSEPETEDESNEDKSPKQRTFGLGSIMKRKAKTESDSSDENAPQKSPSPRGPNRDSVDDQQDDDHDDDRDNDDSADPSMGEDGVDWSSLNKSERRKMRKQIKRGGRAA